MRDPRMMKRNEHKAGFFGQVLQAVVEPLPLVAAFLVERAVEHKKHAVAVLNVVPALAAQLGEVGFEGGSARITRELVIADNGEDANAGVTKGLHARVPLLPVVRIGAAQDQVTCNDNKSRLVQIGRAS